MNYLFDTNSCIYLFVRQYPELERRVAETELGQIVISSIVYAELFWGCFSGMGPKPEQLALLTRQMPVLPFDEKAAETYARFPSRRGSYDRLIAAHALSLDLTLVTNNGTDFIDVPGLKIENWTVAP
jgi:tRNA(fMet)-specific endonuclease VapC